MTTPSQVTTCKMAPWNDPISLPGFASPSTPATTFQETLTMLLPSTSFDTNVTSPLLDIFSKHFYLWNHNISQIAKNEFIGPKEIKPTNNTFSQIDIDLLSDTINNSQLINPLLALESLTHDIMSNISLPLISSNNTPCHIDQQFIQVWWYKALYAWYTDANEHLISHISKNFQKKLSLGSGFYNFSNYNPPPHILNLLKKGQKFVPHPQENTTPDKDTLLFIDYMASFINSTASVLENISLPKSRILEKGITSSLNYLALNSLHNKELYCSILDCFEIALNTHKPNPPSSELLSLPPDYQELPDDCIFSHADKNFGLVLLPLDALIQGEQKMMDSMQAQPTTLSRQDLLSKINQEDHDLRTQNCPHLSKLLSSFPPIPNEIQEIPFLKLNPKIHKLTQEQIHNKQLDVLKFRPVCDSKYYPTKPCSQAMASLLVKLKIQIIQKFPQMESFYPLSGFQVQQYLRSLRFPCNNKRFFIIASCDLSDAYSNCSLDDIVKAFEFLSSIVYDNNIDLSLIKKLGSFALSNNFIESRCKIYHYNPILPMGNCLSGDALDIIAMAGELPTIICPPLSLKSMLLLPPQVIPQKCGVNPDSYMRYRDDTNIIITGDSPQEIISKLETIGSNVFPSHIPTSFEFACLHISFLDCCFYANPSGLCFSTYPRLNFSRPSITDNPVTCVHPSRIISTHASTFFRYKRLCSDEATSIKILALYKKELRVHGYNPRHIQKAIKNFKKYHDKLLVNTQHKIEVGFHQQMKDENPNYQYVLPPLPPSITLKRNQKHFLPPIVYQGPSSQTVEKVKIIFDHINKKDCTTLPFPPISHPLKIGNVLVSKRLYRHKIRNMCK